MFEQEGVYIASLGGYIKGTVCRTAADSDDRGAPHSSAVPQNSEIYNSPGSLNHNPTFFG